MTPWEERVAEVVAAATRLDGDPAASVEQVMDDETVFHCKRELGDIMWYWINSCRSLGLDPNEVIAENVNKLKAR